MKQFRVLLTFICLTLAGLAYSQTTDSLDGRKALMFSFNGLNLGGGFGAKYWISGSTALRFTLAGSYRDSKLTSFDIDQSETISITVTPGIGVEKHYGLTENLSAYLGGGFSYSFNSNQNKFYSDIQYTKTITDTYAGTLFVGVEYWITRSISLSGEQQISLSYDVRTRNFAGENKDFEFGNSTSTLQLLIYF